LHNSRQPSSFHAVAAGFLGWTLDAFDFFVVIFLYDTLAAHFGVSKLQLITATSVTLAFRPLGALLFGMLADRFGRRTPLIANVIFFSAVEFACGFAPNYTTFLILRALYGIGMGGEWGVGASLAMEFAPKRWRGLLSGVLQSGYSIGYLLAAIAARLLLPNLPADMGWRWMFWIGGLPALLALYIRLKVPESAAWEQHKLPDFSSILREVVSFWPTFVYLVLLLTCFMFLSHGTQDLYPDFLRHQHAVKPTTVANIAILYNIGAVLGSIVFGEISERHGRRFGIVAALALCMGVLPLWSFGGTVTVLALAAFLMQMGVQGAWGIVPAHLNEMSPDAVRGVVPGMAYQLGILFASPTSNLEHALSDVIGYDWALAAFVLVVILTLGTVTLLGGERKGRSFVNEAVPTG
jgi:SHS family lactate transporter-like MFS transporter